MLKMLKSWSCLYQALLLNIPGWDWRRDDQAVCLNEVKYGLLAQVSDTLTVNIVKRWPCHHVQSILAPGFFTMASNVVTSSMKEISPEMPRWKVDYMQTTHKVILAETFSPTFVGLTFRVSRIINFKYKPTPFAKFNHRKVWQLVVELDICYLPFAIPANPCRS